MDALPTPWPIDGGTMGEQIRLHDWSSTPIGPIERWPQSLRTLIDILMVSHSAMSLLWKEEAYLFYNDPFATLLNIPAETALGQPALAIFADVQDVFASHWRTAWQGKTVHLRDQVYPVRRGKRVEDAWYDITYNPIRDEHGSINGVLCIIEEVTSLHLAKIAQSRMEASLRESEERHAFLLRLTDAIRLLVDPVAIEGAITQITLDYLGLDRCYYSTITNGNAIIHHDALRGDLPSVAGTYDLSNFPLLQTIIEAAEPFIVEDAHTSTILDQPLRDLCLQFRVISFIDVPVIKNGQPVGILCIVQSTPRQWTNNEVNLAVEVADRTWAAVERAQAEAQVHESAEEFRLLAETVPQIVWSSDAEHTTYFNNHWFTYTGLTQEQSLDYGWLQVIHPDDMALVREMAYNSVAARTTFEIEYRLRRADGTYRWHIARAARQNGSSRWIGTATDIHDLKIAQETLRMSEEHLQATLNQAAVGIIEAGLDRRLLRVNPGFCRIIGYNAEEAIALTIDQVTHPDDLAQDQAIALRLLSGEIIDYTFEKRYIRKDGSVIWVNITVSLIHDSNGEPQYAVAIIQDIDGRKQAEEALRRNEHVLRLITDNVPALLSICDRDMRYRFINAEYLRFFNKPVDAILGHRFDEILGEAALSRLGPWVERAFAGEQVSFEDRVPDAYGPGLHRWMQETYIPQFTSYGSVDAIFVLAVDITAHKHIEAALRASEELFRTVANLVPDLLWRNDTLGAVDWYNQRWFDYTGLSPEAALGFGWMKTLSFGEHRQTLQVFQKALEAGQPISIEQRVRRADGVYRWFLIRQLPVYDDRGHIVQWLGAAIDIHEQRVERESLSEQVAASADQLRVLSRRLMQVQEEERRHLARELHDEVGQALTAIQFQLAAIRRAEQSYQPHLVEEAERLVRDLSQRVSALSVELRPSLLDNLGLVPALVSYIDAYRQRTQLPIDFRHAGVGHRFPTAIETTAYRIIQEALTNIARHAQASLVTILLFADSDILTLTISDDGAGFDPAGPLHGGGLSGMRERLTLLDGTLEIDSIPGGGTTITAEIPFSADDTTGAN